MRIPSYLFLMLLLFSNCKSDYKAEIPSSSNSEYIGEPRNDNEKDCSALGPFSSYDQAKQKIRASDFTLVDQVNMTKSSWLHKGEYYSCNERVGYLIVDTKSGKSYLYANVPVSVWEGFKTADSFGRFYNTRLKGRYGFGLE